MGKPGTPLTDDERDQIARLLGEGHSHAHIARTVGRSVGSVANVAKSIGWSAEQSKADHVRAANEARSAFCAERRAKLAAGLQERAEVLLGGLDEPHLVFNFGGKDNTYEEHTLDKAPIDAVDTTLRAVERCMRTVLAIDKHDAQDDDRDLSAVKVFLREVFGADT